LGDIEFLNNSEQTFLSACRTNNFTIIPSQLEHLEKYVSLLLSHNKHLNLISHKDEQNIWTHHILHCTSLLFHRKFPPKADVLDLGTGGGLPGIVFAIFHPELHFTLLDATRKKIDAVQSMVGELGLKNVRTVWGRAEEIAKQPKYSHKFDIVVARAVAPLEKLVKWAKPLFRGSVNDTPLSPVLLLPRSLVAFKGGDISDEVSMAETSKIVHKTESILLDPVGDKKVIIVYFRPSNDSSS
jgi:16S rRNA (guanine527-N7)-methyltransferase